MAAREDRPGNRWAFLQVLALVFVMGCALFLAHGPFSGTAAMGAAPRPGLLGSRINVPNGVPTDPPSLTPVRTATNTSTGVPITPTSTPTNTPLGTPVLCPPEFQDVPVGHPDHANIHCVGCQGSMDNYPCGQPGEPCVAPNNYPYFRPDRPYVGTRGEICRLIVAAERWAIYTPPTPTFRDVPSCHPLYAYIETAYQHGIISGYSCGTNCLEFRPDNLVSRGQFAKVLYLAVTSPLGAPAGPLLLTTTPTPTSTPCTIHFTDVFPTDFFYEPVRYLYCAGIMFGYSDNTFRPINTLDTMTRAEIAGIAARADPNCSPGTPPTPGPTCIPTGTSTPTVTGTPPTSSPTRTGTQAATLTPTPLGTPVLCPPELQDVPPGHPYYSYIHCVSCQGSMDNYPCGQPGEPCVAPNNYPYFRPDASYVGTRGEICKLIVKALISLDERERGHGGLALTPTPTPCTISFSDVPPSHPLYEYIRWMYCHGAISGYGDGTFRPDNPITRGQFTKAFALAGGWTLYTPPTPTFRDVPATDPFYIFVETAFSRGAVIFYNCGGPGEPCPGLYFRPANNLNTNTRAEVAWIIARAFPECRYPQTPTATGTPPSATRTVTPTGTRTPTATRTATSTSTSTGTPRVTPTVLVTLTPVNTATITPTHTSTSAPTNPPTATTTPTRTATLIPMTFTDVQPSDYFYEAVRVLYGRGVISGYGDNTFRPYNNTTRGQLCKITVLAEAWAFYTPPTPTFRDVPATHTFYVFIETAYSHNIISGYGCGTGCLEFRPGNNVTRAQLCKIVVSAEGWPLYTPPVPTFQDMLPGDPFYSYVETAYRHGIISGYNCGAGCLEFRPGNNATRGQICKIVYSAMR